MARISSSSTIGWSKLALLAAFLATEVCAVPKGGKDGHVKEGESIQEALNNAKCGDEIHVGPGKYPEQLTIDKDGISLIGHGATIIPPTTPATPNLCSGLSGNGTEAGICVTGAGVELGPFPGAEHRKVLSVDTPVKDVFITGFTVEGFTGQNIAVLGGKHTVIKKNTLINGDNYGVLSAGSIDTLIEKNNVTTDVIRFIAMCMDDYSDTEFLDNDITGYFIGLCLQTKGATAKKNRVSNTCVGAFVDPGVEGAEIRGNHFFASNPDCPADGPRGGIIIDGGQNALVVDNVVEGQHNHNVSAGIVIVDDDATPAHPVSNGNVVKKNTLRDNDFDIFVNSTGVNNEVKNNFCTTPGGCI